MVCRISPYLWAYRTQKEVVVAHVPTAVLYRLLQVIVIVCSTLYYISSNLWAYSETPEGQGSIWVEPTTAYRAAINRTDYSSLSYCRRACRRRPHRAIAAHPTITTLVSCFPPYHLRALCSSTTDYTWYLDNSPSIYNSAVKVLGQAPECRVMPPHKIVGKLDGAVYIVTQFQETVEAGWPCSQTGDTPETTCDSNLFKASHPGQPTHTTLASGQCVCESPCAPHPRPLPPPPPPPPPVPLLPTRTPTPLSVATCTLT